MFVKGEHERQFAYEAHTACDRHGFVLGVEVTAGNVHDSVAWDGIYDQVTKRFPSSEFIVMDAGCKTPWIAKNRPVKEGGNFTMNAKEAVARRIKALCSERGMAVNALANICGVSPSTIYSMLNEKSQNPCVVSIQKIFDGLEISMREIFDDPVFEELDPVIE